MSNINILLIGVAVLFVGFIVWVGGSQKTPVTPSVPVVTTPTTTEANLKNTPQIKLSPNTKKIMIATITTSKGVITLELYGADAPNAVANFKKLADKGFYDGTRFHRVIKGFMIQAGDPNSKDLSKTNMWGTGGPGYAFEDEINASSALYQTGYQRGVLAMANSGSNTNGSQFFIMHQTYALPPLYTIFGKVTSGLDVVDAIATTPTGPSDRPVSDIVIKKVEVK